MLTHVDCAIRKNKIFITRLEIRAASQNPVVRFSIVRVKCVLLMEQNAL